MEVDTTTEEDGAPEAEAIAPDAEEDGAPEAETIAPESAHEAPEPQAGSEEEHEEPDPVPLDSANWGREEVRELDSAIERMAALRALHRKGSGSAPNAAGRARFLARLGPGWASRRGLTEMIRAGALEDLDEALALIQRLETDVQRTWCLGDLVEHWELGAQEIAAVLAAAPTHAARRRLAGRVARGADDRSHDRHT